MNEMPYNIGDVVSGVVTGFPDDGGLWLNVGDVTGRVPPREMSLAVDESVQDHYAIGDTVHSLLVFLVSRDNRGLFLSVRRNAPGYIEALNAHRVGDIVSAIVTDFGDRILWLDVGGVVGAVSPQEMSLVADESVQDHYAIGDTIHNLFVWQINHDQRGLGLSVRRDTPGYVEALNAHGARDVVSATVTGFWSNGGLRLDVGGVLGGVAPDELSLADGESEQDHYAVGDTVDDLFVLWVDHDHRELGLSARRNAPGYVEALNAHSVGDVVSGVVTVITEDGGLLLGVGSVIGSVAPDELSLADDVSAQDRYAVGDTIHDLFIWGINDSRSLSLSVKRNALSYVEALNAHSVGDIVSATVTALWSNGGLWLDVDGVSGGVAPWELSLADGESVQDRYTVGDTVDGLFVWRVDHEYREIGLSVRRNAPGYVEALDAHSVGNIVSATVTDVYDDGDLLLELDGVIGYVARDELVLNDDESAQDRYAVGDTVDGLFVQWVDRGARDLDLSTRRNAPGYVEALNAHSVGDVVSATITGIDDEGGLWLDVDGVGGWVLHWELSLNSGESVEDRYAVGDIVHGFFVWQVDHNARRLLLSVRRNTPAHAEALADISVGDPLDGRVTGVTESGLWLDIAGVTGYLSTQEMPLDEKQSPPVRYSDGDSIRVRVWQIDQVSRTLVLSARRFDSDFSEEPIAQDATINAFVRASRQSGIEALAASQNIRIPRCELSLGIGEWPHFEYGQGIRVVVLALDSDGNPIGLSYRRALPEWRTEVDRLARNVVVPDAQVVPRSAVPESEDRAAIDLGPVNGFVRHDELDPEQAKELMTDAPNTPYPVVVEEINGANVIVSRARFEERWKELAADISENTEMEAELRSLSNGIATFDLGSGLLGQMPFAPRPGKPSILRSQDLGKTFPLRVTEINPARCHISVEHRDQWLEGLIGAPESQTLEFKQVLKGDKGAEDAKEMTRQAIRTINAFLNADGGRLIIGVHDKSREIRGLEGDPGLGARRRDPDHTATPEQSIAEKIDVAIQILEANLKKLEPCDARDDLSGLIEYELPVIGGKTLLVVTCQRGPDAGVWINTGKGKREFWVRDGSSKAQKREFEERRAHLLLRAERSAEATEDT